MEEARAGLDVGNRGERRYAGGLGCAGPTVAFCWRGCGTSSRHLYTSKHKLETCTPMSARVRVCVRAPLCDCVGEGGRPLPLPMGRGFTATSRGRKNDPSPRSAMVVGQHCVDASPTATLRARREGGRGGVGNGSAKRSKQTNEYEQSLARTATPRGGSWVRASARTGSAATASARPRGAARRRLQTRWTARRLSGHTLDAVACLGEPFRPTPPGDLRNSRRQRRPPSLADQGPLCPAAPVTDSLSAAQRAAPYRPFS